MGSAKSVLVVEDDDGIREVMQIFLEIEGFRVITAANGRQGLEALSKAARPCLILLDLMMPVMNGWEFAASLKDTQHADIPVVIVSAYADHVGATKCDGLITKPIDLDTLLKTVREWCGNSRDQN